jgi:hypothetical protein
MRMKKCYSFFNAIVVRKATMLISFVLLFLLVNTKQSAAQTTLYFNGIGNLNDVASWGTNTNGTGGNGGITDFTGASFSYIIQNTTNIVFNSGTWTVSGTGTKVFLGNPTTATPNTPSAAITLTISAGNTINTSGQLFDVSLPASGNHKIIYKNTTIISVGTINDANLELVFDGAVIATSTSRTYGNVSLINGASIDWTGATNGPTINNLTIDATSTLTGPVGGSNTWIAIKSTGVVTINGTLKAGRAGGLFTANVAFPVVNAVTNGTLLFNSATVTQGTNLILGSASTIDYYRGTSGQVGIQTVQALNYANLMLTNSAPSPLASSKLYATGDFTVSGTFTVNLLATATITAPTTQNITLLPGARLIVSSGTAFPVPTGAGKFTLQSSAAGTASIGTLATGASITGNVTVQQFIPAGFRKYRFLSHPFTTAQPLSQISDNIDITGNTAGTSGLGGQTLGSGFTSTTTNNPSAYYFNTATADGNATNDGGWKAFLDATTSSWGVGQGMRVLVRGTKGQSGTLDGTNASPAAVTLDMVGAVNTGNVSVPIVTGGSGSTAGFNMVGNPYPSPVDIGAVLTAAGANVGTTFYLRNPQLGTYITVNPIPASYIIPAYTSFFVKANTGSNLSFTEANKNVCTSCATLFRTSSATNNVQLKVLNNGVEYDNLSLNIDNSYNNNYDANDAIKLLNDGFSLYALTADKQKLAASYGNANDSILPLGIVLPKAYGIQTYTIKASDYTVDASVKMYLHDKFTNTYTLLQQDATYNLTIDPQDAAQVGENRLEIVLAKAKPVTVAPTTAASVIVTTSSNQCVVRYSNTQVANTTIRVVSASGVVVHTINAGMQQQGQATFYTNSLAKGLYVVEVQMGETTVTKKMITE